MVDRTRRARDYLKLESQVADILREHDPVSLISGGAPDDEYSLEVGFILPCLREAESAADVSRLVRAEFIRCFSTEMAGPLSIYEPVGEPIWAAWIEFKRGAV